MSLIIRGIATPSVVPKLRCNVLRSLRAPVIALGLLLAVAMLSARAEEPAAKTVSVAVDYGDGSQKTISGIPWKEGQTAFEALQLASKRKCGLAIESRGSGLTTFVFGLDGVKNEGGNGKNWRYQVNGKLADRSAAVRELVAGDAVLWKFEAGQ